MAANSFDRFFLFGPGAKKGMREGGLPVDLVKSRQSLLKALGEASPSVLWLALEHTCDDTDKLLNEALRLPVNRRSRLGGLLTLSTPRAESIQPLEDLFSPFVWSTKNSRYLPFDELAEVLADERRGDLFIGGYADIDNDRLMLVRGDLRRVLVPLSIFLPSGDGEKPDPARLAFTDSGNTVQLGDYEAAADAILYDVDPEFRSRVLAKRRAEEKTFGACLRRLRLLRGLKQSDFDSISAKTIARIERGKTGAPHDRTVGVIAERLDVKPDEIMSY